MEVPPLLKANELVVSRGNKRILDRATMHLPAGSLTVLLGPNGAGKSTLIDVLSGWLAVDAGEVVLDRRPVGSIPARERAARCAVMRQDTARPTGLNVRQSVELGRLAAGGSPEEIDQCADEMLRRMDLEPLASRDCANLSGGEWQRACFARTAAQVWNCPHPAVVLLDEPVSNLDPPHQHSLLFEARALAGDGHAVLAILHDLHLAAHHADRIILLQNGCVIREGPVKTTLHPALLTRIYGCRVEELADEVRGLRTLASFPPAR
jgi:iron complex transport system ATP-binding protein